MKKIFLSMLLLLALPIIITAQEEEIHEEEAIPKNWNTGGDYSFTFSQISLNNWSAGGNNSVSANTLLNLYANYAKGKGAWDNTFTLGYGLSQQGNDNLIKTDDRLLFTTKYGYKASKSWFYSGLFDFKTQMTTGYQDPPVNSVIISELLSPAYMLFSLGMDYKPNSDLSIYISPVTAKSTIVLDDNLSKAGSFGVEPGEHIRSEFGAFFKGVYKKENIIKNVDFYTRLDLFSNLVENPENIDVDWEVRLNMKVNKFLTAVASLNLLYDDDIKYVDDAGVQHGPRIQTKQLLGFGLNFKF